MQTNPTLRVRSGWGTPTYDGRWGTRQQIDPKVYGSEDIDRQNDNTIRQDIHKQPSQEDIQAIEEILKPKEDPK